MEDVTKTETQRDRVRRLLIGPLQELGFRFRKGTTEDVAARRLATLCDDMAYLSDEGLERLALAMRDKGEGSARCFWPERATFIAFAQMAQPRPIEDMPGLASWFASAAGVAAHDGGRLVAEYRWWLMKHRPPMNDTERARISERASEWRSMSERLRDRIGRGVRLGDHDAGWLRAYDADHDAALALIRPQGAA